MVITGDPSQIDLPSGQKSGLEEAVKLLRWHSRASKPVPLQLDVDVVRHPTSSHALSSAYDKAGKKNG